MGPNPWEVQAHLGGDGEFAGPRQELLALPTPHTELQRSPHPLLPHRQVWSLIIFFSCLIPYAFRILVQRNEPLMTPTPIWKTLSFSTISLSFSIISLSFELQFLDMW